VNPRPTVALVGFGCSLGDRHRQLRLAAACLRATPGVEVVRQSRAVVSVPLGRARGRFLNAVLRLHTTRSARGLLAVLQRIEARLGRRPAVRWSDRAIDLDLLVFGAERRSGTHLRLPHPELLRRAFALGPAQEVAPELQLPGTGLRLDELRVLDRSPSFVDRRARPLAPRRGLEYGARLAHPPRWDPPTPAPPGAPMQFFLDTANIDQIREAASWGILDGVTTNPSLVAREGGDFIAMIHEICELVKGPVSAETVATDAEGMIREGRLLAQISEHVVVKVPLTVAGLKATRALSDDGIAVNVTLCFQPNQALLAAKAGATYISPFLGRLDDVGTDGVQLIRDIVQIYANYPAISTQVLAASIRHPMHMTQVALAGAHVATLPFAVLEKMIKHPLTDSGNARFLQDWETVPDRDIAGQVERWLAARGK
jgi:transaldolase